MEMSAIRPKTIVPTAEAASVAEFSSETWLVDRLHSGLSSATTMPMTNRW